MVVALLPVAHHRRYPRELIRVPRVGVRIKEDGESIEEVCKEKNESVRSSPDGGTP
jgi:hypothetical protein